MQALTLILILNLALTLTLHLSGSAEEKMVHFNERLFSRGDATNGKIWIIKSGFFKYTACIADLTNELGLPPPLKGTNHPN